MTYSATAYLGLCVSLLTDHQHHHYFMNLVNSSDDDQDGLWFILPVLCWFCKAKTAVEQEQLFQSLKSDKSKTLRRYTLGVGKFQLFFPKIKSC